MTKERMIVAALIVTLLATTVCTVLALTVWSGRVDVDISASLSFHVTNSSGIEISSFDVDITAVGTYV